MRNILEKVRKRGLRHREAGSPAIYQAPSRREAEQAFRVIKRYQVRASFLRYNRSFVERNRVWLGSAFEGVARAGVGRDPRICLA